MAALHSVVSSLVLSLVITLCTAQAGLRWQMEETEDTIIILTDSKHVLTLEYNQQEQLVQCHHSKEWKQNDAVALLFYSIVAEKRGVKQAIDVNIDKIFKHCQKYKEQVMFNREDKTSDTQSLKQYMNTYEELLDGIEGTRYCGLAPQVTRKNPKVALKKEDRCCKKWHECGLSIQAYSWNYDFWNHRPFSIHGCNCTRILEKCLTELDTELANEILTAQFKNFRQKCLTSETSDTHSCEKWDRYYHKCKKYKRADLATIINYSEYQGEPRKESKAAEPPTAVKPEKTKPKPSSKEDL